MLVWTEQRFLSYLLGNLYSTSTRFNFYRTHKIKNSQLHVYLLFCLKRSSQYHNHLSNFAISGKIFAPESARAAQPTSRKTKKSILTRLFIISPPMRSIYFYLALLVAPTLSILIDTRTCDACSNCPEGQHVVTACTPASDTVCATCSPDFYCDGVQQIACPQGTISPPNSSSFLDCRCSDGFIGTVSNPSTAECSECPTGQFCVGVKLACTC